MTDELTQTKAALAKAMAVADEMEQANHLLTAVAERAGRERDELKQRLALRVDLHDEDGRAVMRLAAERDAARAEVAMLREALVELERTATAEANEKGAGGDHLARITDARAALAATTPNEPAASGEETKP